MPVAGVSLKAVSEGKCPRLNLTKRVAESESGGLQVTETWSKITERFGGWNQHPADRDLRGTRDWVARFPAEGCAEPGAAGAMSHKDYSTCRLPRKPLFPTTKTLGPARESWLSGADSPPGNPETRIDSDGWPPRKGIRTKRDYKCRHL